MRRPRVRRRVYPSLQWVVNHELALEHGRHDSIKVIANGTIRHNGPEHLHDYLSEFRHASTFNRLNFRGSSATLSIAGNSGGRHEYLFNATVRVRHIHDMSQVAPVEIELELNPTRFLAHRPETLEGIEGMRPVMALQSDASARASIRRHTLDGNDNFIPHATRVSTPEQNSTSWPE